MQLQQDQFLNVIDRDEAERRFRAALELAPLATEIVSLDAALGRVLAHDIVAPIDVPGFDRSNVDGFAVRAEDTFGASEEEPRSLSLNSEMLATGVVPRQTVTPGTATAIATGAVVPRGADAVVMVEHTDVAGDGLTVRRPVAPGANITFAGTDVGRGETVLRRGDLLTSRRPGILAHGVALKPGKPLCLAAVRDGDRTVPVVILPGFPTSAVFTFREFVAPVLRRLAFRRDDPALTVPARLPMRVNSERGRTE